MRGSSDKVEPQPVNAPWIQCGRLVRALTWVTIIQLLVIVGLGASLTTLFPLKEIETRYVEFQTGGNNFVKVVAAGAEMQANEALQSVQAREYVMNRELVDKITESMRYEKVLATSSDKVGQAFQRVYGNPETGLYYRRGFKRQIVITLDTALAPGVHQVEFLAYDTQDGQPTKKDDKGKAIPSEWVATIAYSYEDQRVKHEGAVLNPTGWFVTEYALAKRSSTR